MPTSLREQPESPKDSPAETPAPRTQAPRAQAPRAQAPRAQAPKPSGPDKSGPNGSGRGKSAPSLNATELALLDCASDDARVASADGVGANSVGRAAAEALRSHGLPNRKVEAWHYADLRNRLRRFDGRAREATKDEIKAVIASAPPLEGCIRLPFANGRFLSPHADSVPAGASMESQPPGGAFRDEADAVGLLNALFATEGIQIAVEPGKRIDSPFLLTHSSFAEGASMLRHAISLGKGAQANFIESHESQPSLACHSNAVTRLTLEEGAHASWVILQQEGREADHLSRLEAIMSEGSRLDALLLNAGGRFVRREIRVETRGNDAQVNLRGVNLVGGEAQLDVSTDFIHEALGCEAIEAFRNVASQSGKGAFQGKIRVAPGAQKTDARMSCDTLLLSDEAEFSAKPELEIFADDVQCGHGATIADIQDESLFYLRSRGVPEREARALLVKAFVEQIFDEVESDPLRDALNRRIEEWLDVHG